MSLLPIHPAESEVVPVRQIDNSAVLQAQLARLSNVRNSRDEDAVAAALAAIESAAKGKDRKPNLLELAVEVCMVVTVQQRVTCHTLAFGVVVLEEQHADM